MTAFQQHYWEMGSGEWVAVAYLAYMGEPPLLPEYLAEIVSKLGVDPI